MIHSVSTMCFATNKYIAQVSKSAVMQRSWLYHLANNAALGSLTSIATHTKALPHRSAVCETRQSASHCLERGDGSGELSCLHYLPRNESVSTVPHSGKDESRPAGDEVSYAVQRAADGTVTFVGPRLG
jgi:hypothetical protein